MAKLKLNDELIVKVYDLLYAGNYALTAAACLGISDVTYYDWIKKGERDIKDGITDSLYARFSNTVKKGEADAEEEFLKTIKKASINTWQAAAWYLERKHRQKWSTRTEIAHEGDLNVNIINDLNEDEKKKEE